MSVAVRRNGTIEALHRVHAVAVREGAVVAEAGDAGLVTFLRSSAKPLQVLPLLRTDLDLEQRDLAIASASHLADSDQLAAVQALLAKAQAVEDDLECGPEGEPPSRLRHNCSGKHAGMLAFARERGWERQGYRLAPHPVQQACLAEVATAADVDPAEIPTAVDGCGVVTFALPLERIANAFARFEALDGGTRVAAAMRAYPELIRGPLGADTRLMRALPGWFAKGGAEGLFCAGSGGLGIALKVEDGNARPLPLALAAFLGRLGFELPFGEEPLLNSRGEAVGELRLVD